MLCGEAAEACSHRSPLPCSVRLGLGAPSPATPAPFRGGTTGPPHPPLHRSSLPSRKIVRDLSWIRKKSRNSSMPKPALPSPRIPLARLSQVADTAARNLQRLRGTLLQPDQVKTPPTLTTGRMAQLCGVT